MAQNFGNNPVLNQQIAATSGYTGDFGQGGFQAYYAAHPELANNSALQNVMNQQNPQMPVLSQIASPGSQIQQNNPYSQDLNNLMHNPTSTLQADPSYQWRLNQGLEGVNRGMAATGGLGSGNRATALNDYAQGQASTEFQNIYNRDIGAIASSESQMMNRDTIAQQDSAFQLAQQNQGYNQALSSSNAAQAQQQQNFGQQLLASEYFSSLSEQDRQDLMKLAGVTSGSPSTAAQVNAGNNTQNISNVAGAAGSLATLYQKLFPS